MMELCPDERQIKIQKYLWVLFRVNVSMVTPDGSPWKDDTKTCKTDFQAEHKNDCDISQDLHTLRCE